MTPKFFLLKNINMVSKKRRILCWFQIRWCRLNRMPLKKARAKKLCESWVYSYILKICIVFLALAFVRGISESRHQQIWNQHKICVFLIPILIFFKKKNFWVIIALFAILKCKCKKTVHFQTFCKKLKVIFFCQYLSFSMWFLLKFQKKYKIEAPYCTIPIVFYGHMLSTATLNPGKAFSTNRNYCYCGYGRTGTFRTVTLSMSPLFEIWKVKDATS